MKKVAFVLMFALATLAHAAENKVKDTPRSMWASECSSCHVAYPAHLLTAGDWRKLMSHLDNHFGDDASLDAPTAKAILGYLTRHAGFGARHSAKSLRISDTAWFRREHDELPASAWRNPAVKSASNCTACHIHAASGNWSEHGIRLPAGIREHEEEGDEDED